MMNITPPGIRRFLRRFHRSESGTAMTEFAITLPVYLIFLLGISSVTTLHHNVLDSKKAASAALWEDAVDKQRGNSLPTNMAPAGGLIESQFYYWNLEDYSKHRFHGAFWGIDSLAAGTGMYPELGAKSILGHEWNNIEPKFQLSSILCEPSHAVTLNDDMMGAPQGSGVWSTIMAFTGARPGIAAGINYGISYGIDDRSFDYAGFGMSGDVQSHYVASVAPRATPHLFGSLMTYFELRDEDAYRDAAKINWWSPSSPSSGCKFSGGNTDTGGANNGEPVTTTTPVQGPDGEWYDVVVTCDADGSNCVEEIPPELEPPDGDGD